MLVAVSEAEGLRPEEVARAMRSLPTPIVARVARNQLLLDPRTVDPGDDRYVATELARISPAAKAG
jgi:hypothetical protein